ncbi:amino acid permease, partial [bacterium]|nr:amino acid permease [bacterium]
KPLSLVHSKFATPYVSIISFTTLACFFAITGEFEHLAMLSSSSVLLIYLGVALAVIKFRLQRQNDPLAFRIPGGFVVPVLSVITILWFLSNLATEKMIGMVIAIAILSLAYHMIRYLKPDSISDESRN